MTAAEIAAAARMARRAYRAARAAYRRDRDHFVALDAPYTVGTFAPVFRGLAVPEWYESPLFSIRSRTLELRVAAPEYCDGATLAPDRVGSIDLACAYIAHDYWYCMIRRMLADAAWEGWTEADLRALGDAMLGRIIQARSPILAMPYYWAVRAFGGIFRRWFAGALLAAAVGALLGGCAGCAIPAVFEPLGEDPQYHVVPRGGAAQEAEP